MHAWYPCLLSSSALTAAVVLALRPLTSFVSCSIKIRPPVCRSSVDWRLQSDALPGSPGRDQGGGAGPVDAEDTRREEEAREGGDVRAAGERGAAGAAGMGLGGDRLAQGRACTAPLRARDGPGLGGGAR